MSNLSQWEALWRAPRELPWIFVVNMLVSYSYFSVAFVLVLFATNQHGYSDAEANALYGYLGVAAMIFGVLTSPVIDRIGIRRSLMLGALCATIGVIMMATALNRAMLVIAILFVLPFGLSFGIPVPYIGCQQYTYDLNRTLAFSILYCWMNLGASLAGLVYQAFCLYTPSTGPSPESLLIFSSAAAASLSGIVAALTLRDVTVRDDGAVLVAAGSAAEQAPALPRPPLRWYWENTVKKKMFWRVILFATVLAFVRQTYRQFDMTLNKWSLRVFGPDAPIGFFYAVNPGLIVVMAPISALVLKGFSPYLVQIVGSAFSALSLFFLSGEATELRVVCALALFTVGEAMYSSQSTPMILAMSPEVLRATYSVLASVPLFASALPSAWLGATLLGEYCPAPVAMINGTVEQLHAALHRCGIIWDWNAGIALLTPILLIAFWKVIYTAEVRHKIDVALRRTPDVARASDPPIDIHSIVI